MKILHEGKYLRLVEKNGWEYIQRTNCTGIAVIVAVTENAEILIVEQYRLPVEAFSIELPAGLVNDQELEVEEDGLEAARRELFEETGYVSENWHHVFTGPGGAGASADILSFYIALNVKKTGHGGGDHTEEIKVHAVPLNEVDAWLDEQRGRGHPVDPKIYAGLYFLNIYNKKSS